MGDDDDGEWVSAKGGRRRGKKGEDGNAQLHRTGEKLNHFKYMKEFRTTLCKAHQNGVCPNDERTCFYAHDRKGIRRVPFNDDGALLYDKAMCDHAERCPLGNSCKKAHSMLELKYHPLTYKVLSCKHAVDASGACALNGIHCSFAHGDDDMRTAGMGGRSHFSTGSADKVASSAGTGSVALSTSGSTGSSGSGGATLGTITPGGISVVKPDGTFDYLRFKTTKCEQHHCFCDGWHHEKERRRCPLEYDYDYRPCPYVYRPAKSNNSSERPAGAPPVRKGTWGDPTECSDRDDCSHSHTAEEQMYHPDKYKTYPCQRFANDNCHWGIRCSYSHGEHDRPAFRNAASAAPAPPSPPSAAPTPAQARPSTAPAPKSMAAVASSARPVPQPQPPAQQKPVAQDQSQAPAMASALLLVDDNGADAEHPWHHLAVNGSTNGVTKVGAGRGRGSGSGLAPELRAVGAPLPQGSLSDQVSKLQAKVEKLQTQLAMMTTENQKLEEFAHCPVCLDRPRECALYPCGHLVCVDCAQRLAVQALCPQCRASFEGMLRVYF